MASQVSKISTWPWYHNLVFATGPSGERTQAESSVTRSLSDTIILIGPSNIERQNGYIGLVYFTVKAIQKTLWEEGTRTWRAEDRVMFLVALQLELFGGK